MCGSEGARVRHIYYENVQMENFWGKKKNFENGSI